MKKETVKKLEQEFKREMKLRQIDYENMPLRHRLAVFLWRICFPLRFRYFQALMVMGYSTTVAEKRSSNSSKEEIVKWMQENEYLER